MTNTATYVKTLTNMRGDAAVYQLNPPLDHGPLVVVSAVDLDFGGLGIPDYRSSETVIFSTDENDDIDYSGLAMIAWKNHADALQELGYEIVK